MSANPVSIRKILRGDMKMTKAGWIFSYKE